MANSLGLVKTLLIPALVSLAIYLAIFFALIPFIRRYRQRYSQYLPLHTISAHTSSLRDRISDTVMRFVLRATNCRRREVEGQEDSSSVFDDEEGEGMVGFEMDAARRAALDRRRDVGSDARLNRDLEEGFMDDSDDEDTDTRQSRNTRS